MIFASNIRRGGNGEIIKRLKHDEMVDFPFFLFPFLFFMYVIYQILYAQGTREIAVSRPCFTFLSYTSSFVRNLSLNSFQIDDFHPQILSLSRD